MTAALISLVLRVASFVFLVVAMRGVRWGYVAFVLAALLSFPARAGFHLVQPSCELLAGPRLALYSFHNYPHIILFALFAALSRVQFKGRRAWLWALLSTVVMGLLVELAEGVSGQGHCRLRDLLPDAAGAMLGLVVFGGIRKSFVGRRFTPG